MSSPVKLQNAVRLLEDARLEAVDKGVVPARNEIMTELYWDLNLKTVRNTILDIMEVYCYE